MAPDQQRLEGLDKGDHQAAVELMIECAKQRGEEGEQVLAHLTDQRMWLLRTEGHGIMTHTKPPGLEAAW